MTALRKCWRNSTPEQKRLLQTCTPSIIWNFGGKQRRLTGFEAIDQIALIYIYTGRHPRGPDIHQVMSGMPMVDRALLPDDQKRVQDEHQQAIELELQSQTSFTHLATRATAVS